MNRLWLIFAQTVTVTLAILFVVTTLKPEWLPNRQPTLAVQEANAPIDEERRAQTSYRDAARASLPSVVHIYTTQEIKAQSHPLFEDPIFRHFFGERPEGKAQRNSGLGSGVIVSSNGYIWLGGVAGLADDLAGLDGFKGRVVAAGTLQDPALDGPEDVRPIG